MPLPLTPPPPITSSISFPFGASVKFSWLQYLARWHEFLLGDHKVSCEECFESLKRPIDHIVDVIGAGLVEPHGKIDTDVPMLAHCSGLGLWVDLEGCSFRLPFPELGEIEIAKGPLATNEFCYDWKANSRTSYDHAREPDERHSVRAREEYIRAIIERFAELE